MLSDVFKLNLLDFAKGLLVAVIGAVLGAINAVIQSGAWPTGEQWTQALYVGLAAGVAYIINRFFSGTTGVFLK